jgi:hypothetical protein
VVVTAVLCLCIYIDDDDDAAAADDDAWEARAQ